LCPVFWMVQLGHVLTLRSLTSLNYPLNLSAVFTWHMTKGFFLLMFILFFWKGFYNPN
jgi:hypothetical protein